MDAPRRPTPAETAEVVEALARAPGMIVPMVREVPAERLRVRPAPGKWSAHEHACHLAVVQDMFFERLDLMLAADHPAITPYLPHLQQADDHLLRLDLEASLGRFASDRARLVDLLRALTPAQWARTAEHGEYVHYSIWILFRHVVMHDMLHAYRIEDLLLRRDLA